MAKRAWLRWVGLAGVAGVAATGALVVRAERQRREVTPEQVRDRLRARLGEGTAQRPPQD